MSFIDGKPFIATADDVPGQWSGYDDGRCFRCRFCGVFFCIGDTVRFVYANSGDSPSRYGNFLVCTACDGDDILQRAAAQEAEMERRAWWLLNPDYLPKPQHIPLRECAAGLREGEEVGR